MKNLKERFFKLFLLIALVWVHLALIFDVYMLYLHFSDQEAKMGKIINKIEVVTEKMR